MWRSFLRFWLSQARVRTGRESALSVRQRGERSGHPKAPELTIGLYGGVPVPDLPGCMSNGETRELAARNVADAIEAWIEEARALGRAISAPSQSLAVV